MTNTVKHVLILEILMHIRVRRTHDEEWLLMVMPQGMVKQ